MKTKIENINRIVDDLSARMTAFHKVVKLIISGIEKLELCGGSESDKQKALFEVKHLAYMLSSSSDDDGNTLDMLKLCVADLEVQDERNDTSE